ncbi:hypothetical protein PSHT_04685 [Puccinia striiformis]|uniref:DUF7872 domain-containing protein n=1 Tax=Puccinia striiformis TaxID=27350 RepID=A0A2S4WC94_9BASI|nr:hypothetical protein PSHT_04685 [Puccinia striiformis]
MKTSPHPATLAAKTLMLHLILQALLISIFPTVDGHAVKLYTGRESLSLSHRLQKRLDLRKPTLFSNSVAESLPGGMYFRESAYPALLSTNPIDLSGYLKLQTPPSPFVEPPPPLLPFYDCEHKPLTPQSWRELGIDEYLRTYPKGLEINLTVFAGEHKGLNFDCGLNHFCSAGQLCSPISGREWWILAATEQANLYLNSVYTAIGFAASQAKAIGAKLVDDLYVQDAQRKARLFQSIAMMLTAVLAVVCMIAGAVSTNFTHPQGLRLVLTIEMMKVFLIAPGLEGFGVMATAGAVVVLAQVTMVMKAHAAEVEAGKQDTFTKWAHYENQISEWQSKTQEEIGNRAKELVEYPISSHKGLYGILEGGDYCRNSQKKDTNDLEKNLSRVLTIRLVGQILRTKKGFVTIGNGCVQNGPNGAFRIEDGWLSYCDKWDGTMMNVIWDDDGKSGNTWYNARLLAERYGIWPEYIVKQAYECFKLGKGPDFDPYADGTNMPTDENGLCLINLPVCDTNDGGVRKKLKHHSTVKACRTAGGVSLPS